jgi:hypothetical protein
MRSTRWKAVRSRMEELKTAFPTGMDYSIPYNTTKFIQASIDEVVTTFIEAIVLVVLVVFLFLQNWRATLIPVIAVPISIIGTFAGMYVLGFSINLLTLFGLVLAIGIVVDDAIVVLENVERIMSREKLPPREAAIKAMSEVTGPVVAIVLVLCAVFVPVSFMGGLAGDVQAVRCYHRDVGDHLRHCRVDADAGALRLDSQARSSRAGIAVPHLQPSLRRVIRLYTAGVQFLIKSVGHRSDAVCFPASAHGLYVLQDPGLACSERRPGCSVQCRGSAACGFVDANQGCHGTG